MVHKHNFKAFKVVFKNKTTHAALICECGKHGGYAPRETVNFDSLPERQTDRQRRIEEGLPIGCRVCGTENNVQVMGFCGKCRHSSDAKAIRDYAKEHGVRVWDLDKEDLCKAIGLEIIAL